MAKKFIKQNKNIKYYLPCVFMRCKKLTMECNSNFRQRSEECNSKSRQG